MKPVTPRILKQEACYFEMAEDLPPNQVAVLVHTPRRVCLQRKNCWLCDNSGETNCAYHWLKALTVLARKIKEDELLLIIFTVLNITVHMLISLMTTTQCLEDMRVAGNISRLYTPYHEATEKKMQAEEDQKDRKHSRWTVHRKWC